jgi:UDP-GlcNAc:undecaprenyl-phosphate GlcNAc-1-phosphate transferase
MLIIPLVRRVAPRLGLIDMPDPRKVHTVPIPRVGGWGITLGALVPVALVFKPDPLLLSFLVGCLTLFAFGVWDDVRAIGHWWKFLGQLAAASAVAFHGDLWVSRLPFLDAPLPPELGKPFTVFAMIGVINAINHSDGLDGLAGGESILSLIALATLGYMSGNALILSLSIATIGGILGFLRYNSHPAYVFMGDSGSQVLGFTLAFLAVYLTQVANTAVSAALPLLILGVPLADILSVLYQRIRGGMNWFKATRNHVHHRLMQLGFDHFETVVIIYSIQAALVMSAVLARYESDSTVVLVYAAIIATLFGALALAERRGWHLKRAGAAASRLTHAIATLKASNLIRKGPLLLITAITPAMMLLNALSITHIPSDLAAATALLSLVPAVYLLRPQMMSAALLRLAIYATAIIPAYLLISHPGDVPRSAESLTTAMIVVLAVAIVLHVRFSAEQRFGTTPTDYLIVCGVLALLVFGSIDVSARSVVEAVLIATVLMYACEIIVGATAGTSSRRLLQFSTFGTLLIITLRGVL